MMPRSIGEWVLVVACLVLSALMLTQVGCASLPIKAPDGWTPQPDAPVAELHIVVGEQYVDTDGTAHLSLLFVGEGKGAPAVVELAAERVDEQWSGSVCFSAFLTFGLPVCASLGPDGVAVDLDRMVRDVPVRTPMEGP